MNAHDGNHRYANSLSITRHLSKAVCPWRGGLGNVDERNHLPGWFTSGGYACGSCGHDGHSSNLACSDDCFWLSAHCGLDVVLGIRAGQNNRDRNLTNCKVPRQKFEPVRNPRQSSVLAKPTRRPQALTALRLQGSHPRKTQGSISPLPLWTFELLRQGLLGTVAALCRNFDCALSS